MEFNRQPKPINLTLPYPPTVNHYWGRHGNQYYIKQAGKDYRANVQAIALETRSVAPAGFLGVKVVAYPPDRRARDLDNLWKAILDALVKADVIGSDCGKVLRKESIEWADVVPGGKVEVEIYPFT